MELYFYQGSSRDAFTGRDPSYKPMVLHSIRTILCCQGLTVTLFYVSIRYK